MHERKMYNIGQQQYKCFRSIDFCSSCYSRIKLKALRGIFNAVLLCGWQDLALIGQTDESSNFRQIISLNEKHNRDMEAWLTRQNTYKWLSHDIMNEILGMASQAVLRDLVKEVQTAKYFSIVCDETRDVEAAILSTASSNSKISSHEDSLLHAWLAHKANE